MEDQNMATISNHRMDPKKGHQNPVCNMAVYCQDVEGVEVFLYGMPPSNGHRTRHSRLELSTAEAMTLLEKLRDALNHRAELDLAKAQAPVLDQKVRQAIKDGRGVAVRECWYRMIGWDPANVEFPLEAKDMVRNKTVRFSARTARIAVGMKV